MLLFFLQKGQPALVFLEKYIHTYYVGMNPPIHEMSQNATTAVNSHGHELITDPDGLPLHQAAQRLGSNWGLLEYRFPTHATGSQQQPEGADSRPPGNVLIPGLRRSCDLSHFSSWSALGVPNSDLLPPAPHVATTP